jgi:hypothetical protein
MERNSESAQIFNSLYSSKSKLMVVLGRLVAISRGCLYISTLSATVYRGFNLPSGTSYLTSDVLVDFDKAHSQKRASPKHKTVIRRGTRAGCLSRRVLAIKNRTVFSRTPSAALALGILEKPESLKVGHFPDNAPNLKSKI